MFEVLVYLYENYGALTACPDSDSLSQSLVEAGFEKEEVSEALAWLQGLARVTEDLITLRGASETSFRVYAAFETRRLGAAAIGFLSFLENEGQLTPSQREIVIERALATDEKTVPLRKAQGHRPDGAVEPVLGHRRAAARGTARRRRGPSAALRIFGGRARSESPDLRDHPVSLLS